MELKSTLPLELLNIQEDLFFKQALQYYVPPLVGRYVGDAEPQDAETYIMDWLSNPFKNSLLLLGDSGSGKTLFGQWLTRTLFQKHDFTYGLPLFIPLLALLNHEKCLIDNYLTNTCGILDKQQIEIIKNQRLLLILDGYDELHQDIKINLFRSNELWKYKNIKVIITCRSQALQRVNNYRNLFYPFDKNAEVNDQGLQECVMAPFNDNQIERYIKTFITKRKELQQEDNFTEENGGHEADIDWSNWQAYRWYIKQLPGLIHLLSSPFILSIFIDILPSLINKYQSVEVIENLKLLKVNVYHQFAERWFKRQKEKLLKRGKISDTFPIEKAFKLYSCKLANAMLQHECSRVDSREDFTYLELANNDEDFDKFSMSYKPNDMSDYEQPQTTIPSTPNPFAWYFSDVDFPPKEKESDETVKLSIIRSGCPLMQIGKFTYAFLHYSLLEYFASQQLIEGALARATIVLGCELNEKLLVNEVDTLTRFAECVQQSDFLKKQLFKILEESKYDFRVQFAAANAITILNIARVSFAGMDLSYIKIKGANLSNANLYGVNLEFADLREVNFSGAFLPNSKFNNAILERANFGELPHIKGTPGLIRSKLFPSLQVSGLFFSYNGNFLSVFYSQWGGCIELYHFPDMKLIFTSNVRITEKINHVLISRDEKYLIASVNHNYDYDVICIWSIQPGKSLHRIKGFYDEIDVFSDKIMACHTSKGDDQQNCTIKIMDIKTGSVSITLRTYPVTVHGGRMWIGHCEQIFAFFQGSNGSYEISIWSMKTLNYEFTLVKYIGGGYQYFTVDYDQLCLSSDDQLLAVAINATPNRIEIWDIEKRTNCCVLYTDHQIRSIHLCKDKSHIISSRYDKIILWNIDTHQCIRVIEMSGVSNCVKFHPNGEIFAASDGMRTRFISTHANNFENSPDESVIKGYYITTIGLLANSQHIFVKSIWYCGDGNFVRKKQCLLLNLASGQVNFRYDNNVTAITPDGSRSIKYNGKKLKISDLYMKNPSEAVVEEVETPYSCERIIAFSTDSTSPLMAYQNFNQLEHNGKNTVNSIIAIRNFSTLEMIHKVTDSDHDIKAIALSKNGIWLAVAINRISIPIIKIWNLIDKSQRHPRELIKGTFRVQDPDFNCLNFSQNSELLVSGSLGNGLYLCDVTSGRSLSKKHDSKVSAAIFTPDCLWVVFNNDNELLFYNIKLKKYILITSFARRIDNILWHTNVPNGNDLILSAGSTIFSFKVTFENSTPILTFTWKTDPGYSSAFNCHYMDISGAVGLNTDNHMLLKQNKALGKPSEKDSAKVLSDRALTIPYNSKVTIRDLFHGRFLIDPYQAVVSLVRKKKGSGAIHIFLVIQRIATIHDKAQYIITRAEFVIDRKEKNTLGMPLVTGRPLIEVSIVPLEDMKKLSTISFSHSEKITTKQAETLLANIEKDRLNPLVYLNAGNAPLFSAIEPGQEKHNCVTWCEKQLVAIEIKLEKSILQRFLDTFVVHPYVHVKDDTAHSNHESFQNGNK